MAQQERIVKRQAKAPDLVVVLPVKDWDCAECGGTGDLLIMDDQGPLCMTKKASVLSAVVVRWSRTRKRYERQGILVEEAALDQAEQECLADEDARMRRRDRDRERRAGQDVELQARMAEEIRACFPAVRPNAPTRSLAIPLCGAAAGSAARRPAAPSANRRSPWPWSPRSGTRTVPDPKVPEDTGQIGAWLVRNVMRPSMPLFDEARHVVHEDARIRDVATYEHRTGHELDVLALARGSRPRTPGSPIAFIGRG